MSASEQASLSFLQEASMPQSASLAKLKEILGGHGAAASLRVSRAPSALPFVPRSNGGMLGRHSPDKDTLSPDKSIWLWLKVQELGLRRF